MESPGKIELINEVKVLQADRQRHAEAIAAIDSVLARISRTIASIHSRTDATAPPAGGRSGNGRESDRASTAHRPPTRAQKYRKLPLTGDKFVLDLIRRRGSPTTAEINEAWRAEGRGGVANNVIGRLLTRGLIVRESIPGQRGSRYRLAAKGQPA